MAAAATCDDWLCGRNMDDVPTKSLERAYWRRKLPSAFRFFLEMLTQELISSRPSNMFYHAASFLEELLIQRDKELSLLPYESYLSKLRKKATASKYWGVSGQESPKGTRRVKGSPDAVTEQVQIDIPDSVLEDVANLFSRVTVRCNRCGGKIKAKTDSQPPVTAPPQRQEPPPSPPPPPQQQQQQHQRQECELPSRCVRCGKKTYPAEQATADCLPKEQPQQLPSSQGYVSTYQPPQAMADLPLQDNQAKKPVFDDDDDMTVITQPFDSDAWGRLSRRNSCANGTELINTRSLAILVDY